MIEITYTTRCAADDCETSWSAVCAAVRYSDLPWPDAENGWCVLDGADLCPEHSPYTQMETATEEINALKEKVAVLEAQVERMHEI